MNDTTIDTTFGSVIARYTRAEAIADGVLVDVTNTAREAGFHYPVALSAAAWSDCVAWSDADSRRQTILDEPGRLWDLLWTASLAARRARGQRRIACQIYRVPRGGRGTRPRLTTVHLHIGPGDAGEPVITVLMPDED
jgi:hypothetical protein